MNRATCTLLAALALTGAAFGQSASEPNEGSRLSRDAANTYTFSWRAHLARTYFIQTSPDLFVWTYLNVIEPGQGLIIPYGFTSTGEKLFLRLRHTDIPTDDPQGDDFDGDGVSNAAELQAGFNPLSFTDTDGDGLPDDWERFHFGNLSHTANTIEDGGTLTNKEQADLGLNPMINEAATASVRRNYTYDLVGRLTGLSGVALAIGYTVDAEGNITNAQ